MSRRFVLILPFALSMGLFALFPAQADTVAQVRKTIQAAYNQASAAIARKDMNASFAHYAPDFKNISKEGRVSTLQQARAGATRAFAIAHSIQDKNTITNLRLMGNKAIVTSKEHSVLTGVNPRTSRPFTFTEDQVNEDTWIKRSNRWWLLQSKTLEDTRNMK